MRVLVSGHVALYRRIHSIARAAALGVVLFVQPSDATETEFHRSGGGEGPPFAGDWVPEGENGACASIRKGHAEGDFMSIGDGRLIAGAEFGCEIVGVEEQSSGVFHLALECGGSNRHFSGGRLAKITMKSSDRLLMRFNGGEDSVAFVRCRSR